jgi:hypothetical protein
MTKQQICGKRFRTKTGCRCEAIKRLAPQLLYPVHLHPPQIDSIAQTPCTESVMLTHKIRCLVIRVPEAESDTPPRAAWREALPWADPYILGLIRKLQREVRMERAAQSMAARETGQDSYGAQRSEWHADEFERGRAEADRGMNSAERDRETAAAAGSPPSKVTTTEDFADGEEGRGSAGKKHRPRRPR